MKRTKNSSYPYIPNSVPAVKQAMMDEVGAKTERDIFDVIPNELYFNERLNVPEAVDDEYSLRRLTESILNKNINTKKYLCFLGAGCAPHFIPAMCDEVAGRGEIYTSYSGDIYRNVGAAQMIFEYTSMMAELLNMDQLSFSQVCGNDSAGHAMRIASRLTGRSEILVPHTVGKDFLLHVRHYCGGVRDSGCKLEIREISCNDEGLMDLNDLKAKISDKTAAVLIQNPTYLGNVEFQAEEIGRITKEVGAEYIVYVDPISLGVMEAPGSYGATFVVGEGQSLGIHMAAGGGQFGFIAVKDDPRYLSSLKDMLYAYAPTVRGEFGIDYAMGWDRLIWGSRERGMEFTGTSASLFVITAGVYLASLGSEGMKEVGTAILQKSQYAKKKLSKLNGVSLKYGGAAFKEFILNFDKTGKTVAEVNKALLKDEIFGGKDLSNEFPELGQSALYCVTEIHTKADIDRLVSCLKKILVE